VGIVDGVCGALLAFGASGIGTLSGPGQKFDRALDARDFTLHTRNDLSGYVVFLAARRTREEVHGATLIRRELLSYLVLFGALCRNKSAELLIDSKQ